MLGSEINHLGFVNKKAMNKETNNLLNRLGCKLSATDNIAFAYLYKYIKNGFVRQKLKNENAVMQVNQLYSFRQN